MSAPAVEVRHLSKVFGDVVAVDDVSFTMQQREFLALLGPSGCGKTTILRMIAGLETPTSGEIFLNGRLVFSEREGLFVPARERGVGLVFQSYALWPHMTVFDNIAFGLQVKRMRGAEVEERVRRALAFMRLEGLGARFPGEMSGGQQQRVALARMLVCEPQIFLMDEPLSNLDARLRLDMRAEIKNLHAQVGATTLYVTHDQVEGLTMASRMAVLKTGRIEQLGTPKEIYHRPASLFVADFVGSPSINKVKGTVADGVGPAGGVAVQTAIGVLGTAYRGLQAGREVVAAVRPECIGLVETKGANVLAARVRTLLPAGAETVLQAALPGEKEPVVLNVLLKHEVELPVDHPILLRFPPEEISLFDESTGTLISRP